MPDEGIRKPSTTANASGGSKTKIRFVTAASLFDGHDASINIMRRILQASGAEVIHLGHNRSVDEVVTAAVQEDVQGVAVSSYQGGHVEFFKYMIDLLRARGAERVRVFGGGVGTLVTKSLLVAGDNESFTMASGERRAMLRAYDKVTGEEVGAVLMPAPQSGSPMTYLLDGTQYIVVAISTGFRSLPPGAEHVAGYLVAFRLPE